ncbi:hypothetical protein BDZ94DRAFT_1259129 [Collybia nuda]|uniref:Uncharacterized protein n=1 Tax=Collybia nuda TaxID=64659 RepID=A0A9P5Y6Z2_9AGAR|nr:hypothetical protein BDZ94DRAFT_1259129 [Collybia nuda]
MHCSRFERYGCPRCNMSRNITRTELAEARMSCLLCVVWTLIKAYTLGQRQVSHQGLLTHFDVPRSRPFRML